MSPLLLLAILATPSESTATQDPGRVSGIVVTEGGRALANAEVTLTRLDSSLGALSYSTMRSTLTDSSGHFSIDNVQPATWLLDARSGGQLLPFPIRLRLKPDATQISNLKLGLKKAGVIHGRVVAPDGTPLEGVRVAVGDDGLQGADINPVAYIDFETQTLARLSAAVRYPRLPIEVTYSDRDGYFRLAPVLPDTPATLRLTGLPPFHDLTLNGVPPGEFVTARMDKGASIVGTIRNAAGEPTGGARVRLRMIEVVPRHSWLVIPRDSRSFHGATDATSITVGDDGEYRMEGLVPGHYLLIVESKERARALSPVIAVMRPDEIVNQDISLQNEQRIGGRLIAPPAIAASLRHARVSLRSSTEASSNFLEATLVPVAADGSFEIGELAQGCVDLNVAVPGIPPFDLNGIPVGTMDLVIQLPSSRAEEAVVSQPLVMRKE